MDDENEIENLRAALKKANEEAKTYRLQVNSLKEQLDQATASSDSFKAEYVRLKATNALADAGASNTKAARFLDLSKISLGESGELEGLSEQVAALKEDVPELFGPGTKKVTGGFDASNKREVTPEKSSADILAARLNS